MEGTPHEVGEWHQGRNPQRRKIGVLGWALLILLMVALFTLWPS
ncbi:hypothetical protein ACH4SK_28290 [Streptomyces inhibens]